MIVDLILFIVGLVLLIKGSDFFVEAASGEQIFLIACITALLKLKTD
ncbi:hypothetical protein [Thermococcus pacificus]|nr:hypothetical protein [Thermococcus pacificus]